MDTYSFSIFRLFHAPDSSATPIQMKSSMEFIQCNGCIEIDKFLSYPTVDDRTGQWNNSYECCVCITSHVTALSHVMWLLLFSRPSVSFGAINVIYGVVLCFLCRLRSIATHRDHFVRRPSVSPSVTRHNFQSYVLQATHAFLGMLPLFFLLEQTKLLDAEFEYLRVRCKSLAPFLWLRQ